MIFRQPEILKKEKIMSPLGQTVIPMLQKLLLYFGGFGALGLLVSFIIIKIIPKPKNKKSRGELNEFIARAVTALFMALGLYLFSQNT